MNIPSRLQARGRQTGSTLIEALVAILILSIGLLGIAGLQASTLRYSQGGWARAAVASQLSDFADRVRANPGTNVNAYTLTDTYDDQRAAIAALVPAVDCDTATCTPDELAAFHLVQWRLSLNNSMPGAAAIVTGTRNTGYQATVLWYDKDSSDKAEKCDAAYTGLRARNCCPADADVENQAGIRCTNMMVVP
jgi:type IV pilus assembly protein PilV